MQVIFLIAMVIVGDQLKLGLYYFSGLLAAALLIVYQQFLIRNRDPEGCFKAFLNNHWFGAVIFAGLILHYWFVVPESV